MPQNERMVPRQQPSIEEQLKRVVEGISATARRMQQLEEKALSGHHDDRAHGQYEAKTAYAEKAQASRGIGREPERYNTPLTRPPHEDYADMVWVGPKTQPFPTPAARVGMAEADLNGLRKRLYDLCERMVGPPPESATMQGTTSDPIPWGGSMGETACTAERIRGCIRDMHDVLALMESAVP